MHGTQSVERAFRLLEAIAAADGRTNLREVSSASGLPAPTAHRLIRTLSAQGYVRHTSQRGYSVGPPLIRMGQVARQAIGGWAQAELSRLASILGESVSLAILDGDMVLYAARAEPDHALHMLIEVGQRLHAHCTGAGKAILAQLPPREARRIAARTGMPQLTEKTLRGPDALIAALDVVRMRGFASEDGERELGVKCLAVPVPRAPVPAAISLSGPDTRVDDAFTAHAVPLLRAAALRIGEAFPMAPNRPSRSPDGAT